MLAHGCAFISVLLIGSIRSLCFGESGRRRGSKGRHGATPPLGCHRHRDNITSKKATLKSIYPKKFAQTEHLTPPLKSVTLIP